MKCDCCNSEFEVDELLGTRYLGNACGTCRALEMYMVSCRKHFEAVASREYIMDRILGNISGGQEEADRNLGYLNEAFPNHEFEVRPKDTRHQIVLKNSVGVSTPEVERMQRIAQGAESVPKAQERMEETRKTTVVGQDSSFNDNSSGPMRSGT